MPYRNVSRVFTEVQFHLRELHIEELCCLYFSPDIVRMIKSVRTRRAVHMACMGGMEDAYSFDSKNLKGRDHLENLVVDERIILKWV
jgi:hypothetical protein